MTLEERIRRYGGQLDDAIAAHGGPFPESRARRAPRSVAVGLAALLAVVALCITLGLTLGSDSEPAPAQEHGFPRSALADAFLRQARANGEPSPSHVRAVRTQYSPTCPPGVGCRAGPSYTVEGRGRFECRTCFGPMAARGRYLTIVVMARDLRILSFGLTDAPHDLAAEGRVVKLPMPRR